MTRARVGGRPPSIDLYVHPEHLLPDGFALGKLEAICEPALGEALALAREGSALGGLDEVEVTLVSDATIAGVHLEFMAIEGATDVITFDHGEILISTQAAALQGAENGNCIERETALYLVHGLLHLGGYADKSAAEFAEMADLQEQILARIWHRGGASP